MGGNSAMGVRIHRNPQCWQAIARGEPSNPVSCARRSGHILDGTWNRKRSWHRGIPGTPLGVLAAVLSQGLHPKTPDLFRAGRYGGSPVGWRSPIEAL